MWKAFHVRMLRRAAFDSVVYSKEHEISVNLYYFWGREMFRLCCFFFFASTSTCLFKDSQERRWRCGLWWNWYSLVVYLTTKMLSEREYWNEKVTTITIYLRSKGCHQIEIYGISLKLDLTFGNKKMNWRYLCIFTYLCGIWKRFSISNDNEWVWG